VSGHHLRIHTCHAMGSLGAVGKQNRVEAKKTWRSWEVIERTWEARRDSIGGEG